MKLSSIRSGMFLLLFMLICRSATAITLSGNLTLAAGVTTTLETNFIITGSNSTDPFAGSQTTSVILPAGSTSATSIPFSVTNLVNIDDEGWDLHYACDAATTPTACNDIVRLGFYSTDVAAIGTTSVSSQLKTSLPTFVDSTGLTLTIPPGRTLTGNVGMPIGI